MIYTILDTAVILVLAGIAVGAFALVAMLACLFIRVVTIFISGRIRI